MKNFLGICLFTATTLAAQNFSKLPEWARPAATAAAQEVPPTEADAWVLLDRTEFAYAGGGEIRKHHQRLVRVLKERGVEVRFHAIHGIGGKASKIKKLKGWNLRPDGDLVKLDQDEIVTLDTDSGSDISTGILTGASLNRVVNGSYVAFESQEVIRHPLGPVGLDYVMEAHPIRHWELRLAKKEGWFTDLKSVEALMAPRHFSPWLKQVQIEPNRSIQVENIPALPKFEGAVPPGRNVLPWVSVQFVDPALSSAPSLRSWDSLAKWFHGVYSAKTTPVLPEGIAPIPGKAGLTSLFHWMAKELRYRQVYLSPERGWVPEEAKEVHRRRFGDCKDLSSCLLAGARRLGFEGFPALALISDGELEEEEAVNPGAFNHVISALRLTQSLGLPAEVATPRGLFLLVDPTSRVTPLGYLPEGHLGRRVLICTPEGGLWVSIPAAAIQASGTRLDLNGSLDASGRLSGVLDLQEDANHLGLRSTFLQDGREGLKSSLQGLLDLPPTGSLSIEEASNPLAPELSFKVRLKLEHPTWFRHEGPEWILDPLGIPGQPGLIQKPGVPRQFPVWMENRHHWSFHAKLRIPQSLVPVKPVGSLETAFRSASSETSVSAGEILLRLELQRKPSRYGFDQAEEAVKQQKRDRNQWKLFLEEFGSFKTVLP